MNVSGKKVFSFLVFMILSTGMVSAEEKKEKTKADTNREVALTYAQVYLDQKLYEEAEFSIQETLKNDGQDGTLLNFLGLIQMQQRNFAQACHSFRSAVLEFKEAPERAYALYNLADCLFQGNREKDSVDVLRDLAKKEPGVSSTAENTLELIESGVLTPGNPLPPFEKKSRGRLSLNGVIQGGFDSNVLLIEEVVSKGISLRDRGSFYYTPALQLSYLGKNFGTLIDGRLISAYTNYVNPATRTFNNLYERMDIFFGSGSVRWSLFSDAVFLNTKGLSLYNYDVGLMWQHISKSGPNEFWTYEIPVRFQKFILSNGTASENDRTGADVQVRLGYRDQWTQKSFISIQGSIDNQISIGKNYRLTGFSLPATFGLSLPGFQDLDVINTFYAELGGQFFWQSNLRRQDIWYKAGTGLMAPFLEGWNFNLDYYYLHNNSTVDAATYTKGVVSFLLSRDFL